MNNDGLELIKKTIADLEAKKESVPTPPVQSATPSPLMQSMMANLQESPVEVAKLLSALAYITPDTGRGNGSFFDSAGQHQSDHWMAGVWSIRSLNWPQGKDIARNWSQKCPARYTDQGFEDAWKGYKPNHPHHIGIGSLYKFAMQLGWQSQHVQTSTNKYKLLTGYDLRALPPVKWRLKGILPYEGLAAVYGPSGSGKSFLALDQAAAISEGFDWFGSRTTISTVVYVALEGESGFKNRVAAWELENNRPLPSNMYMVMQPFQLAKTEDIEALSAAIPHGSVVYVDTLNRAAPTSDENSSKEMGEILQGCKRLQVLIGGLVVLIHHTGKDASRGARGHSSLFAALDGGIEVERTATQRSWKVSKAKDGEDGKSFPFDLKHHVLSTDADGDQITSCTVTPVFGNIFVKSPPKGWKQQPALKEIKQYIAKIDSPVVGIAGCPSNAACLKFEEAVSTLSGTLSTIQKHKRNNEARRLLKGLTDGGYLGSVIDANGDTWIWIT